MCNVVPSSLYNYLTVIFILNLLLLEFNVLNAIQLLIQNANLSYAFPICYNMLIPNLNLIIKINIV